MSEYEKEKAKKKKWTSTELLSQFNIPFFGSISNKPTTSNSNNNQNERKLPFRKKSNPRNPRKSSNTTDQLPSRSSPHHNPLPSPYIRKHRRTQSQSPQRQRYKHVEQPHNSIDWISRDKSTSKPHKPLLPNYSPASVERIPSAKYGKTKAELKGDNDSNNESSLSYISSTTKNAVGGAAVVIAGFASSLWSSYGSSRVANTIDSTRIAEKKYSKTKQDVRKRISVVNRDVQRKLSNTVQTANKYVQPKLSNVPTTVSKLSTNVLKPLYQNADNDEKNDPNKPSDFHNYSPPRRLPFEKPIKSNPEQKKMRNLSPDNKEDDDSTDNDEDIFNDEEIDEIAELMSNADTISTTATATVTTSTMVTYNVNINAFSIDDGSKPPSPTNSPLPLPSPTVSTVSLSQRSNRSDSIRSIRSTRSSLLSVSSRPSVINLVDTDNNYISFFSSMKQTFEHYYYYNNKIMTPQQHLISRLRELEQIRINFLLCITKSFEYNLIEYDVEDFSKNIPQFDFHLFIEFNNDLQTTHSLNNARLYYLNYLQTFIFHINQKLNTYNQYYINHNNTNLNDNDNNNDRGKIASISGNLNIADRWNQFSRTVTSAMTTYAEDVKNLMGGQRRTLKSRMQFEYVLGTKMGQVLNSVQQTINKHRHELNAAFLAQQQEQQKSIAASSQSITDTSSFEEVKSPTADNTDNKEESNGTETDKNDAEISDDPLVKDKEEDDKDKDKKEVIDDPLSSPVIDDPLGALNGNKPEKEEENENEDDNKNVVIEEKKEENPLMIIEEALAELKLVKDALLGNLDETQLESWLDWQFVEPSPEAPSSSKRLKPSASNPPRRAKPPPPSTQNMAAHRRNLSSSGLPPPKKSIRNSPQPTFSKSTSALKQHPLD